MTAMCGAMMMTVKGSDMSRRMTLAETELRKYAEAIRVAPYTPCAGAGASSPYYVPPNYVADANVTPSIVAVKYWSSASGSPLSDTNFKPTKPASCTGGGVADDEGLQRIDIKVVVNGTPAVERTTTITKRDLTVGTP